MKLIFFVGANPASEAGRLAAAYRFATAAADARLDAEVRLAGDAVLAADPAFVATVAGADDLRQSIDAAGALLMDEPFGALDAMTKGALQDELLRVQERTGATVVFVTHDIDEAVCLSDRIVVVDGSPATIGKELRVELPRPRHQLTTRSGPSS